MTDQKMTDQNRKQNGFQNSESNLDHVLDAALARYTVVEPRSGLEARILASVRAEQAQPTKHAWWQWNIWRWGLAAAIAVIVIVAVSITLTLEKRAQPLVKNPVSEPTPQSENKPETQVARHNPGPVRQTHRHHSTHSPVTEPVAETYPKLDQFPSPQPLSEEEKQLLQYVRQHPEEALLTAKAQEEFDAKIHADLQQATTQNEPSGSDQQER